MAYNASKLAPGSDCGVISASSGYVKLTITLFPYYLLKMPSSPPNPPAADANTGPANAPSTKSTGSPWAIASLVIGILFTLMWHAGAASLSYSKYGSVGWAILDFFFATLYYPYYALVLNTPAPTMMMGGRRRKLW